MKKTYLISLSFLLLIVISCTKTKYTSAPIVITDSLMDGKKWQIEHIYWVDEGVLYQYNRGASNNDNNFDDNYVIFSRDFTGSYITNATTFNTSWSWNDATKTGLTYIIHNFAEGGIVSPNSNFTISWQNVSLTDSTFRYTEMYTHNNGSVVIGSGERTPAPTTP